MRFALLLLALAVCVVSVNALDVSEAYGMLRNETAPMIISTPADTAAAQMLQNTFGVAATSAPGITIDHNAIIVGGPCANPQWTDIAGDACDEWAYDPGEAVVIAEKMGSGTIILIGGTSIDDTRAAVQYLINNPSTSLMDTDRVVINVQSTGTPTPTGEVTMNTTLPKETDSCLLNPDDNDITQEPGCANAGVKNTTSSSNSSTNASESPFA
ncbi:MAG TPA: hypothetical protein VLJ21_01660 [Candidatus Binatia bacterium]|nr:hypothetical protein [Candidatus Binatia bacterium]